MKAIKRIAAVLSAALLIGSLSIGASAAVTDEQKKEITDVLFEDMWEGGLKHRYWQRTRGKVPIEDNPLASTAYMAIEAEVSVCDPALLDKFYNTDMSIAEFYEADEDFDYTKAKKLDKYKDSLIQGYEFGYRNYENGVWEMEDVEFETFYGYFREDAENFKLYDNDTNELLGTYPRLLDYGYLDDNDDEDSGENGGGSGGSTGGNNSTASDKSSSESYSSYTSYVGSQATAKTDPRSSTVNSENETAKTDFSSRYDTDNPAVTPEIASAVDAMKSSAEKTSAESETATKSGPPEKNNNPTIVIVIVAVIVVGAAAFFFTKKKKDGSQQK